MVARTIIKEGWIKKLLCDSYNVTNRVFARGIIMLSVHAHYLLDAGVSLGAFYLGMGYAVVWFGLAVFLEARVLKRHFPPLGYKTCLRYFAAPQHFIHHLRADPGVPASTHAFNPTSLITALERMETAGGIIFLFSQEFVMQS